MTRELRSVRQGSAIEGEGVDGKMVSVEWLDTHEFSVALQLPQRQLQRLSFRPGDFPQSPHELAAMPLHHLRDVTGGGHV